MRRANLNPFILCIALIALFQFGCGKNKEEALSAQRIPASQISGPCMIRGTITLVGTPPVMSDIPNRPCHADAPMLKEETVVVGKSGGLANAFVYVDGLPEADGSAEKPALLDQVDCRYTPHAIGVCVGQILRIRSDDDAMHNVNIMSEKNPALNLSMTAAGVEKPASFAVPEFIPVKCDVHPWMNATIGVFDNPAFTVTDADGNFEIKNLPAGTYTLKVWHERYGKLQTQIDLSAGVTPAISMSFQPPQ